MIVRALQLQGNRACRAVAERRRIGCGMTRQAERLPYNAFAIRSGDRKLGELICPVDVNRRLLSNHANLDDWALDAGNR